MSLRATSAVMFWATYQPGDGRPVCLIYLRPGAVEEGVGVAELPTGTVTFLFTDLEGSTRLWEEHPDAMRTALAQHDDVLRSTIESHGGSVVKQRGDGFHAVFATAHDALDAAVGAQVALAAESFEETGPLRVRMGVHTCEAEYRDGDYYGSEVNRAARLMAVAHGDQIVVSLATSALVREGSVELVDLGEHRLRDLTNLERIFQVSLPGLVSEFPPLRSLDTLPGNLPLQVSSFVGRDREMGRVVAALGETRVVTLTGVGGVGKTRLAVQVAAEVLPTFRQGAWLVELAPVRSAESVLEAVAKVFDVAARSGLTLDQALVEFLRHKELLLVLDNCEHVLDEAAELMELLEQSCPRVQMLATSREGLGIDGERILAVPSLGSPRPDASLAAIVDADAVRLFVDRARGFGSELEVTAENAESIGQVCRRLDGVPLAIELAAARLPAMNPHDLAARLDRRFQLLAGGRRGKVQRHQTLRAVIDWSYDLLSEAERRLLARATVFSGGWTLEAAEAVCPGGPVEAADVFELTERLVARSLVVAEDRGFRPGTGCSRPSANTARSASRNTTRPRRTDPGTRVLLRVRRTRVCRAHGSPSDRGRSPSQRRTREPPRRDQQRDRHGRRAPRLAAGLRHAVKSEASRS